MGQSQASASIWRYNTVMAPEARYAVPRPPGASTIPANSGRTLTPEELAEFIDSLEYDEAPAAVADCADYDSENND
jgi:hypothetical protein